MKRSRVYLGCGQAYPGPASHIGGFRALHEEGTRPRGWLLGVGGGTVQERIRNVQFPGQGASGSSGAVRLGQWRAYQGRSGSSLQPAMVRQSHAPGTLLFPQERIEGWFACPISSQCSENTLSLRTQRVDRDVSRMAEMSSLRESSCSGIPAEAATHKVGDQ